MIPPKRIWKLSGFAYRLNDKILSTKACLYWFQVSKEFCRVKSGGSQATASSSSSAAPGIASTKRRAVMDFSFGKGQ